MRPPERKHQPLPVGLPGNEHQTSPVYTLYLTCLRRWESTRHAWHPSSVVHGYRVQLAPVVCRHSGAQDHPAARGSKRMRHKRPGAMRSSDVTFSPPSLHFPRTVAGSRGSRRSGPRTSERTAGRRYLRRRPMPERAVPAPAGVPTEAGGSGGDCQEYPPRLGSGTVTQAAAHNGERCPAPRINM